MPPESTTTSPENAAIKAIVNRLGQESTTDAQRQMLIESLVTMRSPVATPVFLDHLDDELEAVQDAAREGLMVVGEEGLPYLEEALSSDDQAICIEAAKIIAAMPQSASVRAAMERHLPKLSAAEAIEVFENALEDGGADDIPEGLREFEILRMSYSYEDLRSVEERLATAKDVEELREHMESIVASESWPLVALGEEYIKYMAGEREERPPTPVLFGSTLCFLKERPFASWFAAYVVSRFPVKRSHYKVLLEQRLKECHSIFGNSFAVAIAHFLETDDEVKPRKHFREWLAIHGPKSEEELSAADDKIEKKEIAEIVKKALGKRSFDTFAGQVVVATLEAYPDGFALYSIYEELPEEKLKELVEMHGKRRPHPRENERATRRIFEYLRKLGNKGIVAQVSSSMFGEEFADELRAADHRLLTIMAENEFGCALSHEADAALEIARELPGWNDEKPQLRRE